MSRCFACCQENCGYGRCSCSCHGPSPKETDCPRNIHEAELYRCTLGDPKSAEYWCKWCGTKTDVDGNRLKVKSPCAKHPQYQAIKKPRTACEACWRYYIKGHP